MPFHREQPAMPAWIQHIGPWRARIATLRVELSNCAMLPTTPTQHHIRQDPAFGQVVHCVPGTFTTFSSRGV